MCSSDLHVGEQRAPWLFEAAFAAEALLLEGVQLRGLCLYPILGMPEWHEPDVWTPMGLWDPVCHRDATSGAQTPESGAIRRGP